MLVAVALASWRALSGAYSHLLLHDYKLLTANLICAVLCNNEL
jgi:hypothetical protein